MSRVKLFVLAATAGILSAVLTGCSSIINGSSQEIALTTTPATGALCSLSNPRGEWTVTTPASARIKRSKSDIQIRCAKEGYQDASLVVPSDFESWTLGNLLIGGLIGLGVDASTGAVNKYPNSVEVRMAPTTTGAAAPTPSAARPAASPTS